MSAEDRDVIRRARAQDARRSRTRQGLPERIEDPATVVLLAALLRAAPTPRTEESAPDDQKPAP